MDTKHLVTFVTFAEEKSYQKASFRLSYAPSTLAEHITTLENEFGVKLVENKGRRIVLSECGTEFLEYAKEMLEMYKMTRAKMNTGNEIRGNLRVTTVESLGLYRMASVFTKFMTKYPQVNLSVNMGNCLDMYTKLRRDETDIAFIYSVRPEDVRDIVCTTIFKEPLCFIVARNHYLAKKEVVTAKDFMHQVFFTAGKECGFSHKIDEVFEKYHVVPRSSLKLDSCSLMKKYVLAGQGIGFLPYSAVRAEIENGEMKVLPWQDSCEVCAQILTLKKKWESLAVTEFKKMVEKMKY